MVLNLSKADREMLAQFLAAAEPYPKDAPELNTFDGTIEAAFHSKVDSARVNATIAKALLEQDDLEKAAAKQQKE